MKKNSNSSKNTALDLRIYRSLLLPLVLLLAFELATHFFPALHVSILWRASLLFVLCLALWLCARHVTARTGSDLVMRRTLVLILTVYVYLLICATLLEKGFGRTDFVSSTEDARAFYLRYFVNFIPFRSIWEVYIRGFINGYVAPYYMLLNLLGNLCALVPLAILLPRLFRSQQKWYAFFLTATLTVLAIESLQFLFMVGSCDIDDLILNVGGAMVAYPLVKKIK